MRVRPQDRALPFASLSASTITILRVDSLPLSIVQREQSIHRAMAQLRFEAASGGDLALL